MFFSQCTEAMSQFLSEFWCLDVSCLGPSRLSRSAGPMRSELRCLAAGQPSRPISVEAPLWSQVVGSAYREDQQRSFSLLHALSLSSSVWVLYIDSLFLSSFCFLPSPLLTLLPFPPFMVSPSNHHIFISVIIVILLFSHLSVCLFFSLAVPFLILLRSTKIWNHEKGAKIVQLNLTFGVNSSLW